MEDNEQGAARRNGTQDRNAPSIRSGLALAIAMIAAYAEPSFAGGYVGVRAGSGDGNESIGESGGAAQLFAGYRFDDTWSIEGSFVERDAGLEFPEGYVGADGRFHPYLLARARADYRAITLAARADVPLTARLRLHGRAGLVASDIDQTLRIRDDVNGAVFDSTSTTGGSDVGWLAGFGVDWKLDERWAIGLDLEHLAGDYRASCDFDTGTLDCGFRDGGSLQILSLSLTAEF